MISLSLLMLLINLSGCKTQVVVINQDEVLLLQKGQSWPSGAVPYDGTYYSKNAENRILDAKRTKLKTK